MLSSLWNDVRYSARTLGRNPGFAFAAIATIALGVGVNTGIFTVLNGVLFRDLPAPDADELVHIQQTIEGVPDRLGGVERGPFSTAEYRFYAEHTQTLAGILGHSDPTRTTLGGESPQEIIGTIVTCDYFEVLEQQPALGRSLTVQDCETGADPVVVLTHELWTTAFEADPQIVGRTVELNRQLFTVVGVAREGTYGGLGLYKTAYFAPISAQPLLLPNERTYGNDKHGWLVLLGRRGAGMEQVRAELTVLAAQIDDQEPGRTTTVHVERATPMGQLGFLRSIFLAIGAVVMTPFALVLLIACANIANLLLARATVRSREIALRLSLGASRARVIRQLLIESVLISVAGGAIGSLFALWSFQALVALALPTLSPVGVPSLSLDASPDARVLAVALALMLGTGVLFGLTPALKLSKPDLHTTIKQVASGAGPNGGRLQGALVGVQVALCMVLMIGAGLMFRGLNSTQTIDPAFDYENVAVASYDLRGGGYDAQEAAAFQRQLLEVVSALPGVEAAAQAWTAPLSADGESAPIRLPNQDPGQFRSVAFNGITPGYFDVIGLPMTRGRAFADSDMTETSEVVIVTETTAHNLWPGQEPIGQTVVLAVGQSREITLEVVGVVRDAQITSLGQIPPYYLYLPASPGSAQLLQLLIKSRPDFSSLAAAIRVAAQRLDPGLVVRINPLQANLEYWRALSGTLTALGAALGFLSLALAAVGIYGVVAYFVGRRTREIGIRMALGARGGDVLGLVLKRTIRPVVIGAALGIAAAMAVSKVLSSVLFGVSPFDPIGLGLATLLVLGVAFVAGLLPGRRAVRAEPMAALHHD